MAQHIMDMVLEYAKVFPENADMGDPKGSRAAQAVHEKGGQFIVNAYFTNAKQIDELIEAGLDPKPMNSNRILEGNKDFGIGKYMKIKRLVSDKKQFTDKKTGEPIEVDYGGAPVVKNLTEGRENKRDWDLENDGYIGNGSAAKVHFDVYAQGAGVRLMGVAVTDLVKYENNINIQIDDIDIFAEV